MQQLTTQMPQSSHENGRVSGKKLLLSTLSAALVALVILICVVMPAEFGVDLTGAGRLLSLQNMGEVKQSLARDAARAQQIELDKNDRAELILDKPIITANSGIESEIASSSQPSTSPQINEVRVESLDANQQQMLSVNVEKVAISKDVKASNESLQILSYQIQANDSLELKLTMKKGMAVSYQWQSSGGSLNFDNHGDKPGVSYYNYSKGRKVTQDSGLITAAFDGNHGWFWRNRAGKTVTLKLSFSGEYQAINPAIRN